MPENKNKDKDYIFNRLDNELKQIDEQNKRINQRAKESEKNWVSNALIEIGNVLGIIVAAPFKALSYLIELLFPSKK